MKLRACCSRALFVAIFPALRSQNGTGREIAETCPLFPVGRVLLRIERPNRDRGIPLVFRQRDFETLLHRVRPVEFECRRLRARGAEKRWQRGWKRTRKADHRSHEAVRWPAVRAIDSIPATIVFTASAASRSCRCNVSAFASMIRVSKIGVTPAARVAREHRSARRSRSEISRAAADFSSAINTL